MSIRKPSRGLNATPLSNTQLPVVSTVEKTLQMAITAYGKPEKFGAIKSPRDLQRSSLLLQRVGTQGTNRDENRNSIGQSMSKKLLP